MPGQAAENRNTADHRVSDELYRKIDVVVKEYSD